LYLEPPSLTLSLSLSATPEKIEKPLVALTLASEAAVPATAFTWIMVNRICVGHEDGSVTLWSLHPRVLLSRHAVQHTHVMTMQSAFPSHPYVVSVAAVGGLVKLVDLANPSSDTAMAGTHAVTTEAGLMQWCDHLQAFVGKVPSSNPQNHGIILFPVRHFGGMGKRVIKPDAMPVAIAVGALHPFVLTGAADGSLWANNPARLVFAPKSTRIAMKLRLFQHEFRPVERWVSASARDEAANVRGAVRILTGWAPEPNRTPHVIRATDDDGDDDDVEGDTNEDAGSAAAAGKKKAKPKKKKAAPATTPKAQQDKGKGRKGKEKAEEPEAAKDNDDDATAAEEETPGREKGGSGGGGGATAERPGMLFEPLSRVAGVTWNPNAGFACWAAVALASGIVRVMDLGLAELK
jgi:transcription factor C subunit 6